MGGRVSSKVCSGSKIPEHLFVVQNAHISRKSIISNSFLIVKDGHKHSTADLYKIGVKESNGDVIFDLKRSQRRNRQSAIRDDRQDAYNLQVVHDQQKCVMNTNTRTRNFLTLKNCDDVTENLFHGSLVEREDILKKFA